MDSRSAREKSGEVDAVFTRSVLRDHNQMFSSLAADMTWRQTLDAGDHKERINFFLVSGNYFSTLGVVPPRGPGHEPSEGSGPAHEPRHTGFRGRDIARRGA